MLQKASSCGARISLSPVTAFRCTFVFVLGPSPSQKQESEIPLMFVPLSHVRVISGRMRPSLADGVYWPTLANLVAMSAIICRDVGRAL